MITKILIDEYDLWVKLYFIDGTDIKKRLTKDEFILFISNL